MTKVNVGMASGLILAGSLLGGGGAFGGGFASLSQTASAMGNALTGGAASAEDAGAMWFNPAAMPYLGKGWHLTGAGQLVRPSFKYRDTGSTGAFASPGTGDGGDGGHIIFIPQSFLVRTLTNNLSIGVSVNSPFGLETEYDNGWRGRFVTLKSRSRALNLNPAVAYRIDDNFAMGFGINLQRFEVELTRDTPGAGISSVEADDLALGWNAGMMIKPTKNTRVGAAYRSRMSYDLRGSATFTGAPGANRAIGAGITLPESASVSVVSEVSKNWDVMADVTWTRWSRLQTVNIVPDTPLVGPFGALLPPLTFNWKNTVRVGMGATYKADGPWKIRAGIAYDPTPTNDNTRTPQLPDQDRIFLSLGGRYEIKSWWRADVSIMRQIIRDSRVNVASPAGSLTGQFSNKATILSIQHNLSF